MMRLLDCCREIKEYGGENALASRQWHICLKAKFAKAQRAMGTYDYS